MALFSSDTDNSLMIGVLNPTAGMGYAGIKKLRGEYDYKEQGPVQTGLGSSASYAETKGLTDLGFGSKAGMWLPDVNTFKSYYQAFLTEAERRKNIASTFGREQTMLSKSTTLLG